MAPFAIKLYFNVNTIGFGGSISVPSSLKQLLESLPDGAASLLDWMPDIVLEELGIAFTSGKPSFGLYADAGIAGSAHPSAQAFLSTLQGPTTGGATIVVGLALTTPVEFSGVPVIGTLMSGISLDNLAIVYSGDTFAAGDVIFPPPGPSPSPAFKKGLGLVLTLESGGGKKTFSLTPSGEKSRTLQRLGTRAGADDPPFQWFNVQKTLGPITLGRIGLATSGDWLGIGLDASLALTSLVVDLVGFTAGFPKDNISPSGLDLSLDGLSVFFSSGSVLILGSLVRRKNPGFTSYDGALLIQAGAYGIAAIGSFAQVQGAISLFVFGAVQGVFGGPPAFVVTGIAAGFGYNRALKLPGAEDVLEFPLVLVATLGKSYLPDPKDIAAALGKLDAAGAVPPQIGSYWVAAGIQFSSFQLLNTFALLTVEFGRDLVIGLLGVSSLSLPKGVGTKPYVFAEMTLSAVLRPLEGSFQMMALLTPRSFVIDPNCRLTGGFAFYLWFANHEHSGDFVVTLGGYNPLFVAPTWYPQVPRLGFVWNVSSELHAQGGAYFALTPSSVMAGGALDVRFNAGDLKAWFTAHADFIMWWKPFYFDVDIGVSIGASYTCDFGVTKKTFTVELSAGVHLFGPPIAGTAHVKWWIISFDIDINGGGKPNPPGRTLKDWTTFADTYFPPAGPTDPAQLAAKNSPIVRPLVTEGLVSELTDPSGTIWLVSATNLSLGTETLIPSTRAKILAPRAEDERRFDGPSAGVYPLGSVKLGSEHTFAVRLLNGDAVDLSGWTFTPQLGNAPQSMWGLENQGRPPVAADVMPALLGLRGVPSLPVLSGPKPAPLDLLAFSQLEKRDLPLPEIPPIDGGTRRPERDPRLEVEATVAAPKTREKRDGLVTAMNRAAVGQDLIGGEMSLLAHEVRFTFQEPPMLGPLGSTGPKSLQASPVAPETIGTRRPRGPKPRSGAVAERGAAARLRALYRRRGAGAEVILADGFTTPAERMLLAFNQGETTLETGMTAVFDVAEGSGLSLETDGPVELWAFDRQDQLVSLDTFEGPALRPLADVVARVAVLRPEHCPTGQLVGWTGASALWLIAPQLLLGDQVAIRSQSPLRPRHGRSSRMRGAITGRGLAAENRTLSDRIEPGWTETILPGGRRSLVVTLSRDEGPAGSPMDTTVRVVELAGGTRSASVSLRPERAFFDGDDVTLIYTAPRSAAPRLSVVVQPPSGFRHSGLIAAPTAPAQLDVGSIAAALHSAPAPRQVVLEPSTEVRFR